MGITLAISGKGGGGKTTVAALIVGELAAAKAGSILAVDADPNFNLGALLGQDVGETVADVREHFMETKLDAPAEMSRERMVEYGIQRAVRECGSFDLLTMGRPEGPGCYCYVNHILRKYLDRLAGDYSHVVIDNEAGMEHLSRRTTSRVDLLLIVAQPLPASISAAERIMEISRSLPAVAKRHAIVLNQVRGELPRSVEDRLKSLGVPVAARIPYDRVLEEMMMRGESLPGKGSLLAKDRLGDLMREVRAGGSQPPAGEKRG